MTKRGRDDILKLGDIGILYTEQDNEIYPLISYFNDDTKLIVDISLLAHYLGEIDRNYLARHTLKVSIESPSFGTYDSKFTDLSAFLKSIDYLKYLKFNEFQRQHYLPLLASIIELMHSDFCICGAFIIHKNNLML